MEDSWRDREADKCVYVCVCVALRLTSKNKCFTLSRALIRPWAGNESLSFVLGGWGGWIQCPPLSNGPGWDKMPFA